MRAFKGGTLWVVDLCAGLRFDPSRTSQDGDGRDPMRTARPGTAETESYGVANGYRSITVCTSTAVSGIERDLLNLNEVGEIYDG